MVIVLSRLLVEVKWHSDRPFKPDYYFISTITFIFDTLDLCRFNFSAIIGKAHHSSSSAFNSLLLDTDLFSERRFGLLYGQAGWYSVFVKFFFSLSRL